MSAKAKNSSYRVDIDSGDVIELAGQQYLVIENWGQMGKVKEYPEGAIIERFAWRLEGEEAKVISKRKPSPKTMKLSQLLKRGQEIKELYGDLDIQLVLITSPDDPEAIYLGDLTRLEVEERTILNLISFESEQ